MWTVQWVSSKAITVASRLIDNMTEGIHLEMRGNKIHHPKSIKTSSFTKGNNLNYVCHKGLASSLRDKFINQMWLAELQQFCAYLNSHVFVFYASQTITSSWLYFPSTATKCCGWKPTCKYISWMGISFLLIFSIYKHTHAQTHTQMYKN